MTESQSRVRGDERGRGCDVRPGSGIFCFRSRALQEVSKQPDTGQRSVPGRLCNEGLVQIVPFRGTPSRRSPSRNTRNLYEVQSILDPMIAGLAAGTSEPGQIKEMDTGKL